MRLYEVQATEYNSEQEYYQSKLLAAENIDQAWQIARDYFQQWYDDGDGPEDHNTDNSNEFEFISGCIRLQIQSVKEITLDEWIKRQINLHSIGTLPEELLETDLTRAAKCAMADLEGFLEEYDISRDDEMYPAALTRRELLAAIADFKEVSL